MPATKRPQRSLDSEVSAALAWLEKHGKDALRDLARPVVLRRLEKKSNAG